MRHLRVPAEWECTAAIWLTWPHNRDTWPGRFESVPPAYAEWIAETSPFIPVCILGRADDGGKHALAVSKLPNVRWFDIATNDSWIRDYGSTFVWNSDRRKMQAINWRYNAWGGKYPPWDLDNAAATEIAKAIGVEIVDSPLCVEGGALEWDGSGRLLTTSGCLLTETRNPGWSRDQVCDHLSEVAGAREFVWVDGGGLAGDDTDGHIDQLVRFIDQENIVVAVAGDPADPNASGLEENARLLAEWSARTQPRVNVHRLPTPPPREIDGQRVPESYCNFLRLGENRLLMPTFGDPESDQRARGVLRRVLQHSRPGAEVIGIDCTDLIWGLGALHCASLNQPPVEMSV